MTQKPQKKLAKIVYLKGKEEPESMATYRNKKLAKLVKQLAKEKGRHVSGAEWFREQIDKAILL